MNTLKLVAANTDGELVTTSLAIAEGVNYEHASVIRLIRDNKSDFEDFGLVRFEIRPRAEGKHGGGNTEYALLNQEQATLLLTYMRNSEIVKKFKKRLVKEFYELKRQQKSNTCPYDALIQQCQLLKEQNVRLTLVEDRQEKVETKLDQLNPDTGYRTVLGHCRVIGVDIHHKKAKAIGQKASALCKKLNIDQGTVPDERYGNVNSYPIHILEQVFSKLNTGDVLNKIESD